MKVTLPRIIFTILLAPPLALTLILLVRQSHYTSIEAPPSAPVATTNPVPYMAYHSAPSLKFEFPANDYSRVIDITNFRFTTLHRVCNGSYAPLLIVLVNSHPNNFKQRNTIRATWGGGDYGQDVRLVFVLGQMPNDTSFAPWLSKHVKQQLIYENKAHGDLIIGSIDDTYRNITYKHVMAFKYVVYHCPSVKYVLKTDDDVFVNMPLMLNLLRNEISPYGAEGLIFCRLQKYGPVFRSYRSKWRVSPLEYRGKTYPPYCPGWVLLYSLDVVYRLYLEAQKSEYFWVDDVHITGTLAQRLNLKHGNLQPLILKDWQFNDIMLGWGNRTDFLLGPPDLIDSQTRKLWEWVTTRGRVESILEGVRFD